VSTDFDSTLSEALNLAADAAQIPGPAAARTRGRKRTVYQRIAISTTSLALVAIAATVAFKAVPSHANTTPVASTSTKFTVSAGNSAGSSSVKNSAGTASKGTSGDPHKVVPGAWLAADQLPFADTFKWKVEQADSQGSPIGQPLTPSVYYVANDTSYQSLTMCSDPSWLLPRTTGAQHSEFLATTGTGNNQASQYLFFFATDGDAKLTFNNLTKQYGPTCQQHDGGAEPVLTAGNIYAPPQPLMNEMVWLTVKGKSSAPDLADYTREYFVLRGNVIAYVAVTSYTDTSLPTKYDDDALLSTISSHLSVYRDTGK
jgi:hypothetical protein